MKQTVAFFLLVMALSVRGQDKSQIFNKDVPITWLGLDFTKAKLIGDRERYGSESDMRRLVESWNNIFLKEPDKFNVARALRRKEVTNAIEVTNDHNQQLDILAMYSDNKGEFEHMKVGDIDEVIGEYDLSGLSGIGVMFVVESFSKLNGKAAVWVTFVDLKTNQVLMTERMTGDPGGAGMRNYWANACHDILEKIKGKEYDKWRKLYSTYK